MNSDAPATDGGAALRAAAEAAFVQLRALAPAADGPPLAPEATQVLLHELQVHQIELEMQNDELRRTQTETDTWRSHYFDLYELAPLGYCTVSDSGLVIEANLALASMLGVPRTRLVGGPLARFMRTDGLKDFYLLCRKALQSAMLEADGGHAPSAHKGADSSLELSLSRPDGSVFWAQCMVTVAPQHSLGVIRPWRAAERRRSMRKVLRVVVLDIDARRQAEEAQRASEASQRLSATALNSVSQGVLIAGPDRRIVFANEAFLAITGFSAAEITGRTCAFLQGPGTDAQVVAAIAAALHTQSEFAGEILNYRKDGSMFWNELTISPVREASGALGHFVGVTHDITARKQAQLDLLRALREKEALLREVHHRVKNNLQVISSLLRLEGGRSMQAETQTVLGAMRARIRAMAVLHESLYRTDNFAAVDLSVYLRELAVQAFNAQLTRPGAIALQVDLASVSVTMEQAMPCGLLVSELISNSLKHGFPDGRAGVVHVSLQPGESATWWRLCVSDNGVGLPPDFDAKRQAKLGLQLAGDLAEQIGGPLHTGPNLSSGVQFWIGFKLA